MKIYYTIPITESVYLLREVFGGSITVQKLLFLEKRLAAMSGSLTKNDKRVLDYLCTKPEEFTKLNITELAEAMEVSVAAISRFAQKIGFEKLTDFKLAISKEIGTNTERQFRDIQKDDDFGTIAAKVITRNIEAMNDVLQMLNAEGLETAITYMRQAKRMVFTGLGGSASVAQDAHHKFRRMGIVTELVTDVNTQMILSTVSDERDLIIVISNEGANKELNLALNVAKQNGVKIIAITQLASSPLIDLADVSLLTLVHEFGEKPEALISRVSSYCIIDIIYVAYCMRENGKLEKRLSKLNENMKLLKNYDS